MAQHRIVDKTTFNEIGKWTKEKIDAKALEINESVDNKVDKVEGSSLATSAQLKQIETNKTDITEIKSQLEGVEASLSGLNTRMGAVV